MANSVSRDSLSPDTHRNNHKNRPRNIQFVKLADYEQIKSAHRNRPRGSSMLKEKKIDIFYK